MKTPRCFNGALPPTPESFHRAVVRALQKTEEEPMKKRTVRVSIVAAVLAAILLVGTALAVGSHLGILEFLGQTGRVTPAGETPDIERPGTAVSNGKYTLTVCEGYCAGDTANILVEVARSKEPFAPGEIPFWGPSVKAGADDDLPCEHEERWIDGKIYYYFVCALPDGAAEALTLYIESPFTDEPVPVPLSKRPESASADVAAGDRTIDGAGITFDGISLSRTALDIALTLTYSVDRSAIRAPELPSPNLAYFTGGDGVYHMNPDCLAIVGDARPCPFDEIAGGMRSCSLPGCSFFTEPFSAGEVGFVFELVDAQGDVLETGGLDSGLLLEDGRYRETLLIRSEAIPESFRIRAFDCWTKYRWRDTVEVSATEIVP